MTRSEMAFDSDWFGAQRPRLDTTLLDAIDQIEGVDVAEGHIETYAQLVAKHGKPIGNPNNGCTGARRGVVVQRRRPERRLTPG